MSDYFLPLPDGVTFDMVKSMIQKLNLPDYTDNELRVHYEYDHITFYYYVEGGTRHNNGVAIHLTWDEERHGVWYPSKHPWATLSDGFYFLHRIIFEHIAVEYNMPFYEYENSQIPRSEWLITNVPAHANLDFYLQQQENNSEGWKKYMAIIKHAIGDNHEKWRSRISPFNGLSQL